MQYIVTFLQVIQPFMFAVFVSVVGAMIAAAVFIRRQNLRPARIFTQVTAILSGIVMLVECLTFIATPSLCNALLAVLWGWIFYSHTSRYLQLKQPPSPPPEQ